MWSHFSCNESATHFTKLPRTCIHSNSLKSFKNRIQQIEFKSKLHRKADKLNRTQPFKEKPRVWHRISPKSRHTGSNVNKISARHAIIHEAANTICFQRVRDELSWKLQPLCTKFYDCVKTTSACTMRRDVWHAIKWKPKTIAIRLVNL